MSSTNNKQTIFITGATGNVGGSTFQCLMDEKKDKKVVIKVGVHDEKKGKKFEEQGAMAVTIDMNRRESLVKGFQGVDVLLAIPPPTENRPEQMINTVEAAKEAGVRTIVLFSVLNAAEEKRILFQKQLAVAEEAVKKSGLQFVIVESAFFQENFLGTKDAVRFPLRDGATCAVSLYDIGRTLSHILLNPQPHLGKTYKLTGPVLESGQDIADAFSQVRGKKVVYVDTPPSEAKKVFLGLGMAEWQVEGVLELLEDYAQRRYPATNHIEKITGKIPRTIRQTIQATEGIKHP